MNILISGASGLLGKALIERNRLARNIIGIYLGNYKTKVCPNAACFVADVTDKRSLLGIFYKYKIDVVIHTAGISDVDFCEKNYEQGYYSNVLGTQNIIELCEKEETRLVYISSNAVFDGKNPPYKETDSTSPVNNYGRIKVECENMVKKRIDGYLIVRPILMYGWNDEHERKNLVTFLLSKLNNQEIVNMVTDIFENPLSSYYCADVIWSLIERNKQGIYHVAGRDVVNRYEYAMVIADIFNLDKNLIKPVDSNFFPDIAPRPKNTSFITNKLEKELGFIPLGLRNGLVEMKELNCEDNPLKSSA